MKHFNNIKTVMEELENDSMAIKKAKETFKNPNLSGQVLK